MAPSIEGMISRRETISRTESAIFALGGGDDDVLAAFLAAAALVEHAERFADARGVAQEDLEAAAAFAALLRLHAAQQFVGIEPAIGSAGHYA